MGGIMAIPKDARIGLSPEDIPKRWYNLAADLPNLKPPLNPGTGEPAKPEDFEPIFCKEIIRQEGSTEIIHCLHNFVSYSLNGSTFVSCSRCKVRHFS